MYEEGRGLRNGCPELRLILLGSIGCGKTLTGDTILGGPNHSSSYSSSRICQTRSNLSEGRRLTLVEAPRWYWSGGCVERSVAQETERALYLSTPGPHAFLLLIPVSQFTEMEKQVPTQMEEVFGKGVLGHTMVLFTCGDYLVGRRVEEYLAKEDPGLRELLDRCGGRYHVINNRRPQDREQVRTLLDKVEAMARANGGFYVQRTMQTESEDQTGGRRTAAQDGWTDDVEGRQGSASSAQTRHEFPSVNGCDRRDQEVDEMPLVMHLSNGLHAQAPAQQPLQMEPSMEESKERRASFRLSADGALLSQLLEEQPSTSYVNTIFHRIPSRSEEPVPVSVPVPVTPSPSLSLSPSLPLMPAPHSPTIVDVFPELRLLLLGRKGAGKRGVANRVLGSDAFVCPEDNDVAACQECERKRAVVAGRKVTVVDTPDWLDSELPLEVMRQDLTSGLLLLAPGPHAFLLCVPVDQPVHIELWALGAMEKILGPAALWGHTLVLFTHGDRLEAGITGLEQYVASQRPDLLQLVQKCSDRYHVMDMGSTDELLQKVEQAVRESGGSCFSQELNPERIDIRREEVNQWTHSPYLQAVREEDEEEDKDYARRMAEKCIDQTNTRPSLSSFSSSPSRLHSVSKSLLELLMRIPKLLASAALLGGIVGVYLGGPLGGAVGATVGTVATEAGRRKYSNKMKTQ